MCYTLERYNLCEAGQSQHPVNIALLINYKIHLLPHLVPWVSGLPQMRATQTDFSMLMIFSTSSVMCLHTHGKSTFLIMLQHPCEGLVLGPCFCTYFEHSFIKPSTSPWHWPNAILILPKKAIAAHPKNIAQIMKRIVLQNLAITLGVFYLGVFLVSWVIAYIYIYI